MPYSWVEMVKSLVASSRKQFELISTKATYRSDLEASFLEILFPQILQVFLFLPPNCYSNVTFSVRPSFTSLETITIPCTFPIPLSQPAIYLLIYIVDFLPTLTICKVQKGKDFRSLYSLIFVSATITVPDT